MCGLYFTNQNITLKEISTKLSLLKHRGPDKQVKYVSSDYSMGHARLSIIDLDNRSDQPMSFDGLKIIYNGEIFNFIELRKRLICQGYKFNTTSDTEVLLKGYHAWREKILDEINGMFAFTIYDKRKQKVFFARDRLGVKPLFYSHLNGVIEVSSSLDVMSSSDKIIDKEAVSAYLQTGYIPSPLTIYSGIKKVIPGTFVEIDIKTDKLSEKKYWDLSEVEKRKISYKQAKEELHNLIKDAVKIRMISDVPLGSFLSGGIDSALISSIANKLSNKKLKTFTIGFTDQSEYDESELSKTYSEIIKSDHKLIQCKKNDLFGLIDVLIDKYDEPFGDSSAIPSILLNKKIKPYLSVALSGDGGDESFFGYNHFDWAKKVELTFILPYYLRRFISFLIPKQLLVKKGNRILNILKLKSLNDFIERVFIGFDNIIINPSNMWMKYYSKYLYLSDDFLQNLADLNIKLWLENDSNVKVDRASMANSVEVRSPFLDYRIIEFCRRLPVNFRYSRGKRKKILKEILSEYIPKAVFDQPKKGFGIPLESWIRNELKLDILSTLRDTNLNKIPNLNVPLIKKYLRLHLKVKQDNSYEIWRVYILIKWLDKRKLLDNIA